MLVMEKLLDEMIRGLVGRYFMLMYDLILEIIEMKRFPVVFMTKTV
jgi:hypothetical protein